MEIGTLLVQWKFHLIKNAEKIVYQFMDNRAGDQILKPKASSISFEDLSAIVTFLKNLDVRPIWSKSSKTSWVLNQEAILVPKHKKYQELSLPTVRAYWPSKMPMLVLKVRHETGINKTTGVLVLEFLNNDGMKMESVEFFKLQPSFNRVLGKPILPEVNFPESEHISKPLDQLDIPEYTPLRKSVDAILRDKAEELAGEYLNNDNN